MIIPRGKPSEAWDKRFKILANISIFVIALIVLNILLFKPASINCYATKCQITSLDKYHSCNFTETTGGGFLIFGTPERQIYNCDGQRIEAICEKYENVVIAKNVTAMYSILNFPECILNDKT